MGSEGLFRKWKVIMGYPTLVDPLTSHSSRGFSWNST